MNQYYSRVRAHTHTIIDLSIEYNMTVKLSIVKIVSFEISPSSRSRPMHYKK